MSSIQLQITKLKKKQENRTHNQEKHQTIETKAETTEMMELADKYF